MRGLMLSMLALSWLGLLAGCQSCGSSGSHGCGSGCGGGGCGARGGLGGDGTCLQHGICDCEMDDYCCTRSPWVRYTPVSLGAPIEALPPVKELPKGKL